MSKTKTSPTPSEHDAHVAAPPFRGILVRPMKGGGWQSREVLIPAEAIEQYAQNEARGTDIRQNIMGGVENWYSSTVLGQKWRP
jgi:hypothetical protein